MPGSTSKRTWFNAGHFRSEEKRDEAETKLCEAGCEIVKRSDEKTDFMSDEPGKREQVYILVWKETRDE